MTTHKVTYFYRADDEESRYRPLRIICEGKFGQITNVIRVHEKGVLYKLLITMEDDPETVLQELRTSGVYVLRMMIDEVQYFNLPEFKKIYRERVPKKPV